MHSKPIDPLYHTLSFQRGEEEGFNFFFKRLYPALCFFANKIIHNRPAAEEIASEAFIKIWQRHGQFSNAGDIKAYLYQIVKNDSLKWMQKDAKISIAETAMAVNNSKQSSPSHFEDIVWSEVTSELHQAISSLPMACRQVFEMLYIEGKSITETAAALRLSPSTVRTQKARGLVFLRRKWVV